MWYNIKVISINTLYQKGLIMKRISELDKEASLILLEKTINDAKIKMVLSNSGIKPTKPTNDTNIGSWVKDSPLFQGKQKK